MSKLGPLNITPWADIIQIFVGLNSGPIICTHHHFQFLDPKPKPGNLILLLSFSQNMYHTQYQQNRVFWQNVEALGPRLRNFLHSLISKQNGDPFHQKGDDEKRGKKKTQKC